MIFITDTRPAFFAIPSKNPLEVPPLNLLGDNAYIVKFDDVKINRGDAYNPSTGIFTAPRKGLYQFSCMILGQKNQTFHFQLNKNDDLYVYGRLSEADYGTQIISALMELKEGDRVYIFHRYIRLEIVHGKEYSTFSGYYIHE